MVPRHRRRSRSWIHGGRRARVTRTGRWGAGRGCPRSRWYRSWFIILSRKSTFVQHVLHIMCLWRRLNVHERNSGADATISVATHANCDIFCSTQQFDILDSAIAAKRNNIIYLPTMSSNMSMFTLDMILKKVFYIRQKACISKK